MCRVHPLIPTCCILVATAAFIVAVIYTILSENQKSCPNLTSTCGDGESYNCYTNKGTFPFNCSAEAVCNQCYCMFTNGTDECFQGKPTFQDLYQIAIPFYVLGVVVVIGILVCTYSNKRYKKNHK